MPATRSPRLPGLLRRLPLAFALLLLMLLAGCRTELFGRLEEADANEVLDALYAEGIAASKLPGEGAFWRIEVASEDHQRALHVARRQGLPRERFATLGQLFKKEGLVSSPAEERQRYIFAVSQELAGTLSQIDGVVSARVHPVIPANDPLADRVRPASAAVFIKHLPDADLQQLAPAIKTLVTRSIEGLAVENVSLTFFAAKAQLRVPRALPAADDGISVAAALAVVLAVCLALALLALGLQLRRRQPPLRGNVVPRVTPGAGKGPSAGQGVA